VAGGWVCGAGDAAALAARVATLMDQPAVRAKRVTTAGAWVRAERTWAGNGKAFDDVYRFARDRHAERAAPGAAAC
jgi:hypothetical protein